VSTHVTATLHVPTSSRFNTPSRRLSRLVLAAVVGLGIGLPSAVWASSFLERASFVLEPGAQYGGSLEQKRFRESSIRYNLHTGFVFGIDAKSDRVVGVTLHSAFAGSDSRFSIRPRFTWDRNNSPSYTISAGYIFHTAEDANGIEDAEVSDSGFVGGGSVNLGDLALQLDVSIVDVGPTVGHEGGTETSLFGGVGYRGIPGVKIGVFALSIVLVLSAIYIGSIS
jgi:hypothetical protein